MVQLTSCNVHQHARLSGVSRSRNPSSGPKHMFRSTKRSKTVCSAEIVDKDILVVGASRGIGLEFVKQLAQKGNRIHATVRGAARDDLQYIQSKSQQPVSIGQLDISDPASIKSWAETAEQPFDYALCVAGVVDDWADLDEVDEERMVDCFKVNAIGPLLLAQALTERGLLKDGSVLANLTSKMGSIADNSSGGSYAYRASKAAVNQITKSLSIDLEELGITVVLLHPGFVRTSMTRFSGKIDPEESVAGMISVLESSLPLHGHWYDYTRKEIPW